MVFVLISTILGVIGGHLGDGPSMLVAKKPQRGAVDRQASSPYQGYVGSSMFLLGGLGAHRRGPAAWG